MKSYWTLAALLSLLLTVGCADRTDPNAQNTDTGGTPAATPPADSPARPNVPDTPQDRPAPASPRADTSADRPSTQARSEGTGGRASGSRGATTSPRETTPAAPARRAEEWRELTLPEGTALPLELQTALSSETAQIETPVRARLRQAILVNGTTALPAGAVLVGQVTDVERSGKVKGRARLAFTFTEVQAGNVTEDLRTNPLIFEAEQSKGEDATKIGAGAVGGAIVGGILGGKGGAAKGAAIGGAAGTGVVLATRGKEVTLASGTDLAASLAEPLKIRVAVR
jgi:hypothetical protein